MKSKIVLTLLLSLSYQLVLKAQETTSTKTNPINTKVSLWDKLFTSNKEKANINFMTLLQKKIITTSFMHKLESILTPNEYDELLPYQLPSSIKIDINYKDKQGLTPLMYFVMRSFELNFITDFLENEKKNLNINAQDNDGNTALMFAVLTNNDPLFELLLKKGADPNIKNIDGNTTLHFAIEAAKVYGNTSFTNNLLTTKNLNFNAANNSGRNALMLAVKNQDLEIVNLLLKNQNDKQEIINKQDRFGKTPLIIATENDNSEMVELLLKHNAQKDLKDKNGNTAEMIAYFYNFSNVATLLSNDVTPAKDFIIANGTANFKEYIRDISTSLL
ncbi:ankyrin repeat domain-containing protein [Candidatus Dependentiae bacterium]|nr:ankyrin repeat domain-containing protein [Candidatus Dependentiae bacterium]